LQRVVSGPPRRRHQNFHHGLEASGAATASPIDRENSQRGTSASREKIRGRESNHAGAAAAGCFLGRPPGRSVASRPSASAVGRAHGSSPSGAPRRAQARISSSSACRPASVPRPASLTHAGQSGGTSAGQDGRGSSQRDASGCPARSARWTRARPDHRQSSAVAQTPFGVGPHC
jgi:hypothetical protein